MKRFLVLCTLLACGMPLCARAAEQELRGVWVSSVFNLDYPSQKGLTEDQLRAEADAIIAQTKACGLNAIFLQVRPCADSLYPSKLFPWSEYVSGTQGLAPDGGFDPLAYFIEKSHAAGIQLHAWCNPYRVTKSASKTQEEAMGKLASWHPARRHPELLVFYTDGNLYFNPGLPEARALIQNGILEIVEQYDVDGIHLDDYFYPGSDFQDQTAFETLGKEGVSLDDFRRESVNTLVSELSQAIKAAKPNVSFGISPFGIWANKSVNALGSDTVGGQSYYSHYADTRKWVKEGLLDYIAPQLYWYTGSPEGEFSELLRWWCETVSGTDVKLYIGLGAYRLLEAADQPDSPWYGTREMASQLMQCKQSSMASGVIFFRSGSLSQNTALTNLLSSTFSPKSTEPSQRHSLTVTRPASNIKTAVDSFYIMGASDNSSPLFLNGKEVLTRSPQGYYGELVPLAYGANEITLQNGQSTITRTIFRWPERTSGPMEPVGETILPGGSALSLSCPASGAQSAQVLVNGELQRLKPDGSGNLTYKVPLAKPDSGVTSLGRPLYFIRQNGFLKVAYAEGAVSVIPEGAYLTTEVQPDLCDIFPQPDSTKGASYFLRRGMTVKIPHTENGFAHIPDIGYVRLSDLKLVEPKDQAPTDLTAFAEQSGNGLHRLTFSANGPCAAYAKYEDGTLKIRFTGVKMGLVFESKTFGQLALSPQGAALEYTITLPDAFQIAGYWLDYQDGAYTLSIKEKQENGLAGKVIVLDAGHGGDSHGAVGPDPQSPEKLLNLQTVLELKSQLEDAGATVILTREADQEVELTSRLQTSFAKKPDVFLSIHSNSAPDNVDMSLLSGVELYMQSPMAKPLAGKIAARLQGIGRVSDKIVTDSMLYVVRGEFTLSILVENEYITSPQGFERLQSEQARKDFCSAITAGLTDYFSAT